VIHRRQLAAATIFLLLATAGRVGAQRCNPPADGEVTRLLEPTNLRQLDSVAPTKSSHLALIALYRSRRYSLVTTEAEARRYFRSLPRSNDELWCVYSLTKPGAHGSHKYIGEAVYKMFDRAAHIARTLGRGHDRVLCLALWSDGELAYGAWEAVGWLLENDPILTANAIRRLPPGDQKRMCRGAAVTSLTTSQIVRRCEPGIWRSH
jgi:hypothetical protein